MGVFGLFVIFEANEGKRGVRVVIKFGHNAGNLTEFLADDFKLHLILFLVDF